jgi:ATP-dependent Clp protease ATP-binding subunit ClpA
MKIVKLEVDKLVTRLKEKKFDITFDESVLKEIISRNKEEQYGARPIKRIIQSLCEDYLSDEILRGTIVENKPVIIEFKDELVVKS